MPTATFTSAGSSSNQATTTANGDSPDVLLLVFAYVVPCIFTIGLLLYLFYCCDSKSKKNVDDDDNDGNDNNSRGLPNEETSLLPPSTTNKDYIPPATTTAPDLEEGVSKPPPKDSGLGSYLPQFMLPTPIEKPTAAPVADTNNKDPSLLTPTLDTITKSLPKPAATNASAPAKVSVPAAATLPVDNNAKDNEGNKPSSFPSLYFNPMDLMGGGGVPTTEGAAVAPAKVPVQFVIAPEGSNNASPVPITAPLATGVPTASTSVPAGHSEPSSFPSLYFNPMDLMGGGGVPTTEGAAVAPTPASSNQPSSIPASEESGTTILLPSLPSMPSMNILNPMDLLSGLNPSNVSVAGPPAGPPIAEGIARDLVDRNNPVLFEIYLFYSFHAAAVLNARTDGHASPIKAKDLDQHKVVAIATDRYDRRLLGHSDFLQLLKDFKVLTGSVTGPYVSTLLATEDSMLTFRRFVALLLSIGETLQPRYPKQDAFLALLETMDYSEQLYIILESGLVLNKEVSFDVAEPTWRSVVNEDVNK